MLLTHVSMIIIPNIHLLFHYWLKLFIIINMGVWANLRAPRLIPHTLKLTTM